MVRLGGRRWLVCVTYREGVAGSRHRNRDDSDGVDVSAAEARLLATLLELTVVVAQTGAKVVPPLDPPAALRPFLQFTAKVPAAAFRAARRVLDEDPLFRARVATVATEELVGRAGSLYVRRPDGWEEGFRDAVIDAMGEASSEGAVKRAGRLEKKLAGMESALARAEADLARIRIELVASQGQLAEERRARTALAAEAVELQDALASKAKAHVDAADTATEATSVVARLTQELAVMRERAEAAENSLMRRASFDAAVSNALTAFDRVGAELRSFHAFRARFRFEAGRFRFIRVTHATRVVGLIGLRRRGTSSIGTRKSTGRHHGNRRCGEAGYRRA